MVKQKRKKGGKKCSYSWKTQVACTEPWTEVRGASFAEWGRKSYYSSWALQIKSHAPPEFLLLLQNNPRTGAPNLQSLICAVWVFNQLHVRVGSEGKRWNSKRKRWREAEGRSQWGPSAVWSHPRRCNYKLSSQTIITINCFKIPFSLSGFFAALRLTPVSISDFLKISFVKMQLSIYFLRLLITPLLLNNFSSISNIE